MILVITMDKKDYHIQSLPRTFEQVSKQIVDYIRDERLKIGDKLPPERKLAELLQVSRSSVREGLRVLELLKYVYSRHGGGTFVAETPPYAIPALLLDQNLNETDLNHYFQMGLTVAEKIVFSSLGTTVEPKVLKEQSFWPGFTELVFFLGKRLENPHYVNLWSDCYNLLEQNGFFEGKIVPFTVKEWIDGIVEEDRERLTRYFDKLSFT
ncbi:MAG TPA: GntR family transcriptional regulator [Bacillales bacterium]|nr:GntR family transcriptional regulator [Bacillales bacterium]